MKRYPSKLLFEAKLTIKRADRFLLTNVTKDGEKWRDHVWIWYITPYLERMKIGKKYSFYAEEYTYDIGTKKGIENLKNIKEVKMDNSQINVFDIKRRENSVLVKFIIPNDQSVDDVHDSIEEIVTSGKNNILNSVEVEIHVVDKSIIVQYKCEDIGTAKAIKDLYKGLIDTDMDHVLALGLKQESKVKNFKKDDVAPEYIKVMATIKFPKSTRVFKQYQDLVAVKIDGIGTITRDLYEALPTNKAIELIKVKTKGTPYYCYEGAYKMNLPTSIVQELEIKTIATLITEPLMDLENFVGVEEGLIVSKINGVEVKILPELIKRHGEEFEVLEKNGRYYHIDDTHYSNHIPVAVINLKKVSEKVA